MDNVYELHRTTDPETSREAAESVTNMTLYRMNVLVLLDQQGPMTDEELVTAFEAAKLPHSPSGVRTRRAELVRTGHVRWTGEWAPMSTGRRARTWEVPS